MIRASEMKREADGEAQIMCFASFRSRRRLRASLRARARLEHTRRACSFPCVKAEDGTETGDKNVPF